MDAVADLQADAQSAAPVQQRDGAFDAATADVVLDAFGADEPPVLVVVVAAAGVQAVGSAAGLAVRLRALGTQVRVCAPPVGAAAAACEALVATGVVPAGGWR